MSHRHDGTPQAHSAHPLAVETGLRKDDAVGIVLGATHTYARDF